MLLESPEIKDSYTQFSNAAIENVLSVWSASATPYLNTLHIARGSEASPANVVDDDILWRESYKGYYGGSFLSSAYSQVRINASPSGTSMPAVFEFWCSPNGTVVPELQLTIHGNGVDVPNYLRVENTLEIGDNLSIAAGDIVSMSFAGYGGNSPAFQNMVAGGTSSAPAALDTLDRLFFWSMSSYDTTEYLDCGHIMWQIAGTVTEGNIPTVLELATNHGQLILGPTGNVIIGGTSPSLTIGSTTISATALTLLDDASTSAMRTTLGVAIGTDVQAWDADLDGLAGLTYAADAVPYATGAHTFSTMTVTSAARSVLDDATVGAMLATLGGQPLDATLTALAALANGADLLPYFTGTDTFGTAAFKFGTWTPTISTSVNVTASTVYAGYYVRIGSMVIGIVNMDITATAGAGTETSIEFDAPVTVNFTSSGHAGGAGTHATATRAPVEVLANATTDKLACGWDAQATTNSRLRIIFFFYVP